jgi:hypothetical protein
VNQLHYHTNLKFTKGLFDHEFSSFNQLKLNELLNTFLKSFPPFSSSCFAATIFHRTPKHSKGPSWWNVFLAHQIRFYKNILCGGLTPSSQTIESLFIPLGFLNQMGK